jgi:hypothetical protein
MAIAFARSLRSLQADGWRGPLWGLLAGIILVTIWASWFFLSSIAFTETGRLLGNDGNGFLIAQFPTTHLERLKRGQQVTLRWQGGTVKSSVLHAVIAQPRPKDLAAGQVRLAIVPNQSTAQPAMAQPGLLTINDDAEQPTVSVEALIERLSPARLVMRRIGMSHSGHSSDDG